MSRETVRELLAKDKKKYIYIVLSPVLTNAMVFCCRISRYLEFGRSEFKSLSWVMWGKSLIFFCTSIVSTMKWG